MLNYELKLLSYWSK